MSGGKAPVIYRARFSGVRELALAFWNGGVRTVGLPGEDPATTDSGGKSPHSITPVIDRRYSSNFCAKAIRLPMEGWL